MESNVFNSGDVDTGKGKYFVSFLKNIRRGAITNEDTIDRIFECALLIQEAVLQEEQCLINEELILKYPGVDFTKSVDLLMECLLQSQNLDEGLVLHAIKKYILIYSKSDFCKFLDNVLGEVKLRECLFELNQQLADIDLDLFRINNLLFDVVDSVKIFNALNTQTSLLLNAVEHSSALTSNYLIDEIIHCLESQSDLRIWFMMVKQENLNIVLKLCGKYKNFLEVFLKFFDRFADEIESNYDEDLNVKYSHINLDFDEFVNLFQLFLNDKIIGGVVADYLNERMLINKNFCFWIDVKACL